MLNSSSCNYSNAYIKFKIVKTVPNKGTAAVSNNVEKS